MKRPTGAEIGRVVTALESKIPLLLLLLLLLLLILTKNGIVQFSTLTSIQNGGDVQLNITSTDSDTLYADLYHLDGQRSRLRNEKRKIAEVLSNETLGSDERDFLRQLRDFNDIILADVEQEIPKLRKLIRRCLRRERALERSRFTRPSNKFIDPFNRMLGPLPEGLNTYQPTKKNLRKVRSYRLLGCVLLIAAIVLLISLSALVPWLAISPATLITSALASFIDPALANILVLPVCIALIILLTRGMNRPRYEGKGLDGAAMWEEQWFRTGAESWTARQRLCSCVAFGAVHAMNIVYPLASLIVVGLLGGVLMLVYLREYKKSGSRRRATFASAKLHATYNRFAFLYMIVAASMGFILPLLP